MSGLERRGGVLHGFKALGACEIGDRSVPGKYKRNEWIGFKIPSRKLEKTEDIINSSTDSKRKGF